MLKLPTASQNYLPTQPFKPPALESHETSSVSDLDITNAQTCKFRKVVIENSEGASGNCSTTTHSSPPKSMKLPPLLQLFITDHFHNKLDQQMNQEPHPSSLQQERHEHIRMYSLVRSSVALSNL